MKKELAAHRMRTPSNVAPLKAVSPETQHSGKKVRQRADGQLVRKQTFELGRELSKQLAAFCVEHERSMTSVVEEGIRRVLFDK